MSGCGKGVGVGESGWLPGFVERGGGLGVVLGGVEGRGGGAGGTQVEMFCQLLC